MYIVLELLSFFFMLGIIPALVYERVFTTASDTILSIAYGAGLEDVSLFTKILVVPARILAGVAAIPLLAGQVAGLSLKKDFRRVPSKVSLDDVKQIV